MATFDPNTILMQDARTGEIPTEWTEQIMSVVTQKSAFTQLAQQIEMDKPIKKISGMGNPEAYWVKEGDENGTSTSSFTTLTLETAMLAVTLPITKQALRYSVPHFFRESVSRIATAFHQKLDQAAFCGVDSPYKSNVFTAATSAGNTLVATNDIYQDINKAMEMLEKNDYSASGLATTLNQKSAFRGALDKNGYPIFNEATQAAAAQVLGLPIAFLKNVLFGTSGVQQIIGDWDMAYYGILQNIEYQILDQATIPVKNGSGERINLATSNMLALQATMEVAVTVADGAAFSVITKAP